MKNTFIPLLVAGAALIATGCDQQPSSTTGTTSSATPAPAMPEVNKADAIASVNGKYISKEILESLEKDVAARMPGQSIPKEKLVEELIQRELLIQDAIQKQLDKSPEVLKGLEEAKKNILTNAAVQNFMKTNPVTDEEVKAEYDSKFGGSNTMEYKARHILVKTEAEAKKIIAELDKGADFAKLANKHSLDGKEAQNGGDLGWFSANQMVEPFSKAVIAQENGKYSKTPVQTQFGWHIILKEDARPQTPPPIETIKQQITPYLQRKKVQTMLETMRKQAKVEVLIPLTEEKPKADANAAAQPGSAPAEQPVSAEEKPKTEGEAAAQPAAGEKAEAPAPAEDKVVAEEVKEAPKAETPAQPAKAEEKK